MKVDKWIDEQQKKYEQAVADHKKNLIYAIQHENPEGAERHTSALVKSQWYLDEILPVIKKYFVADTPKKPKKK